MCHEKLGFDFNCKDNSTDLQITVPFLQHFTTTWQKAEINLETVWTGMVFKSKIKENYLHRGFIFTLIHPQILFIVVQAIINDFSKF